MVSDSIYWSPYLGARRESESGIEKSNTVFVGALHGLITAPTLASIMEETYGGTVLQVTINTDKYLYPIGKRLIMFYVAIHQWNKSLTAIFLHFIAIARHSIV